MSSALRVVVAAHGHCFDGLCSAALFTRLLQHVHAGQKLELTYRACGYGPGQGGVAPSALDGDVNAIVDYRFSDSSKLTWYFDHHVSAFPSSGDRARYEERVHEAEGKPGSARRMFHDGTYSSCTKLIADVGAQHFDLDPAPVADIVHWADMIDSAAFPTAEMAVARVEPELMLMTVIEHKGNDAFLQTMVPRLLSEPLADIARAPEVQEAYAPLRASHEAFVGKVRAKAQDLGAVVLVDLSAELIDVAGKFVTYALYPKSAYSVMLTRSKSKCKLSIGYNPWSGIPRTHDIASICERHGGGGHPVVGAITLPPDQLEKARALAGEVAAELRG